MTKPTHTYTDNLSSKLGTAQPQLVSFFLFLLPGEYFSTRRKGATVLNFKFFHNYKLPRGIQLLQLNPKAKLQSAADNRVIGEIPERNDLYHF